MRFQKIFLKRDSWTPFFPRFIWSPRHVPPGRRSPGRGKTWDHPAGTAVSKERKWSPRSPRERIRGLAGARGMSRRGRRSPTRGNTWDHPAGTAVSRERKWRPRSPRERIRGLAGARGMSRRDGGLQRGEIRGIIPPGTAVSKERKWRPRSPREWMRGLAGARGMSRRDGSNAGERRRIIPPGRRSPGCGKDMGIIPPGRRSPTCGKDVELSRRGPAKFYMRLQQGLCHLFLAAFFCGVYDVWLRQAMAREGTGEAKCRACLWG